MLIADQLSRTPLEVKNEDMILTQQIVNEINEVDMTEHVSVSSSIIEEIEKHNQSDEETQALKNYIMKGWPEKK